MRLYWPRTESPTILPIGKGDWQPPAIKVRKQSADDRLRRTLCRAAAEPGGLVLKAWHLPSLRETQGNPAGVRTALTEAVALTQPALPTVD